MTRAIIAERMGWTLEYVDTLSKKDVMALLGIWDGQNKSRKQRRKD